MAFEKLVDRYSSTRSLARWDSWVQIRKWKLHRWPGFNLAIWPNRSPESERNQTFAKVNYYKPLKSPDKIKNYYFCRVFVGTLQGTNTSHQTGSLENDRLKSRLVGDIVIVFRRVLLGESANRTANHLPKSRKLFQPFQPSPSQAIN